MLHRAVSPVEFCSNLIPTEGEGSWSKPNQLIHELTNKYSVLRGPSGAGMTPGQGKSVGCLQY